ncbi:MAG: hypothetical protein WCP74_04405 [Sphingobacteriia bacterium]|jgi:hypothetical protein
MAVIFNKKPKTINASFLLAILTTLIFCSCGQQTRNTANQSNDPALETDSAKLEHYYQWQDKTEYFEEKKNSLSAFSNIEKNRDSLLLLKFLTANYKIVKPIADFPYKPADLVKSTHAIDINGDQLLDFVYDGPYSGDYNITQIFLNMGNQYKKVFSGKQDIVEWDFSNKLNSFTIINPGCCADPGKLEYSYAVSYSGNEPTFKLEKTIGYYNITEKPKSTFSNPKEFTVKTDNAKLRFDCYKLDIEHPFYGNNGNSIATYKIGAKGKALGSKKDNDNEWVYVIMNAENKIDNCDFSTLKEQPTEIKGWILKTDIDWK